MPPVFALIVQFTLTRARACNRKKPSSAACTARSQHFNSRQLWCVCAHGKPSHFIALANHKFIKFAKYSHVRWCDGNSFYGVQGYEQVEYIPHDTVRCALTHACLKARIIKIKHKVVFNWTRCWHLMCTHTSEVVWECGTNEMSSEHSIDSGCGTHPSEQRQNYMHFMVIGDSWSLQLEDLVTSASKV